MRGGPLFRVRYCAVQFATNHHSSPTTTLMKKILFLTVSFFALTGLARAAEANENWDKNCASCHGKDGKGATKAGRMAGVKDLSDAALQKTFTDEQGFDRIKNGLKDEKGKEKMKPFAEKLNDGEIKALVAYVRALQK
jgi:cytochrome c553